MSKTQLKLSQNRIGIITTVITTIGVISGALLYNWDKIFPQRPFTFNSNVLPLNTISSTSKSPNDEVLKTVKLISPTLDYTANLIEDQVQSEWSYVNEVTASFSYRFLNTSAERLNCLIEMHSGYCKSDKNCLINSADWTEREKKVFPFIIEPFSSYQLT